ncbi:MAG: 50S ribosomal protein L18 [Bdellovibrionales bacterium CG10_big_fil_rev_8_21_14_0_10_45_34]|nr:MAG: 50S ribosomal protein L18 [Bdellovibrionales bacterium CG10_big_fil_rev_8_21_14_0_10_45_34]
MRVTFKKRTSVKETSRLKKRLRIRKKVTGTAERPRLTIFRSTTQLTTQLIDDTAGKTLAAASTSKLAGVKSKKNKEAARELGKTIAKLAVGKNIKAVVFDRSGLLYHGKVKEFAESARESGLEF